MQTPRMLLLLILSLQGLHAQEDRVHQGLAETVSKRWFSWTDT